MKLYYWPKTRSFRLMWAMEELGEPYELVRVDLSKGEQHEPAFRAVNPFGKVPALSDGEVSVADSGAILLYLGDRFPEKALSPALSAPERGRYLQWMFFPGACLEPAAIEKVMGLPTNTMMRGWGDWERVLRHIREALEAGPWLVGGAFTFADLYLGSTLDTLIRFNVLAPEPPIGEYIERLRARPAYRRACAIEDAEIKALNLG
jgi:glutathione S-transferase